MSRTALVTGGSRGIGRAIALRLARNGIAVGVNYRSRSEEAAAVVSLIEAEGGRAVSLQADVGDPSQVAAMIGRLTDSFGPCDILINNAGILARGDLADFDYSLMEPMRRTNVDGLVSVTRAVAPGMVERKWGRIVNISSLAALGAATAGTTFYAATKAAVIALTRRFALDLSRHGVTVNCIAPGFILTDMVAAGHNVEDMANRAMVRRTGTPEDIAHAAAFLVSEESGFITAQTLVVDGGRTDYIAHP